MLKGRAPPNLRTARKGNSAHIVSAKNKWHSYALVERGNKTSIPKHSMKILVETVQGFVALISVALMY